MLRRIVLSLVSIGIGLSLVSCKTEEPPVAQTPAFGGPVSTIPWNQPQHWEGGAGGFSALQRDERN